MSQYLKGTLEILGIIVSLTLAYYELKEVIPTDQHIVFEVEKLNTPVATYSLTGVVSDQDYVLESVRFYSEKPATQATFKYDHYNKNVDLISIKSATPYIYIVSRELLQKEFGEDKSFIFEFLDDNRFSFSFKFEGEEKEKAKFTCRILAVNNISIPCQLKETGYLSLFRGIPWYFLAAGFGIILIIIIEVFDIFLKRGRKISRKSKKNRLIADQEV